MRIQRNMLGLWDSLVCICFSPNLLGCVLEQPAQEAAATPGSPLGWTAPVKWHSTGTSLAPPPQIPETPSPVQSQDRCVERSCWCKGLCYLHATGLCCHSIHSTELVSLGFPACYWVLLLRNCWNSCPWLSQQLCWVGNASQVQKWHCFLSKVQVLPALLCWSSVWGDRHCWLHGMTASSRFLWLQQWFKFSSAHPCT